MSDGSITALGKVPDFFISYTGVDAKWAEWVAWCLEEAGHTTIVQVWDFRPGHNFVLQMQRACLAKHTIAILSNAYLEAFYTQPEWAAALSRDPTGLSRKLIPVRIDDCKPNGLLAQIIYIDLFNLTQDDEARLKLLKGIKDGRAKPTIAPRFPASVEMTSSAIAALADSAEKPA